MKKVIFRVIEVDHENKTQIDEYYSYFIIVCIILSLIPLMFKTNFALFQMMEEVLVIVFIGDYLLRWITADLKLKKGWKSYFIYPITPFAIVDLLAVLPFFTILSNSLSILRILRLVRVLCVLKVLRYSRNYIIMSAVFRNEKKHLISVVYLAVAYIVISALVMFSVESTSFPNFFDAIYWSTTALTTIGYGDLYPVTTIGKLVSMVSALFGIAIVAIPSGIITAGYLREMAKIERKEKKESEKKA